MESFLRFQLSGINGPVRSAKLTLTATTNGTVDGPGVHSVSGDWSESTVTWATRPGHGADAVSDAGAIASNAKVEYDVKSLVTGDGTLDLALIATSTDGVELSSKEHLNIAKRPVLEVTFATPFDDEAPTAPADLAAQVASQSRVDLSWTAVHRQRRRDELRDLPRRPAARRGRQRDDLRGPHRERRDAVRVHGAGRSTRSENRSAASNAATVTVPDTREPHHAGQPRGTGRGRGARRSLLDRVHRQRRRHELRGLPRRPAAGHRGQRDRATPTPESAPRRPTSTSCGRSTRGRTAPTPATPRR